MKKSMFAILLSLSLTLLLMLGAAAAVLGDADGDGEVTAADARITLRAAVGLETVSPDVEALIDVDGEAGVSSADARLVLRAAVGLETLTPADPAEHEHVWNDGEVTTPATCADGVKTFTCTVCGETKTEAIPGNPNAHVWDEGVVTLEPTSTAAGRREYTCTVCGAKKIERIRILGLEIPANNEYDVYRGKTFYIKGQMFDGSTRQAMEIALSGDTVYMLSEFEGAQMAVQVIGKDIYMILPSKKTYYKMDKEMMDLLGLTTEDLIPEGSLDFGDLPSLLDADYITEAVVNDRNCRLYHFDLADGGHFVVCMDGGKLIYTETHSSSWNLTEGMYFDTVSASVPADLLKAGAGNRRILLLTTFMTQIAGLLG